MKYFVVVLALMLNVRASAMHPYVEQYYDGCQQALAFYHEHQGGFAIAAAEVRVEPAFLFAIVAPEISQFSYLSNHVETAMLKTLYVQGGKAYADFSIGPFQMKPSFIERMEDSLWCNEGLRERFSDCFILHADSKKARIERVKRLSQPKWQLRYLSLFCALTQARFEKKQFSCVEDKLKFYAAVYNVGFHRGEQTLCSIGEKCSFPHFSHPKYQYRELAMWFYIKMI